MNVWELKRESVKQETKRGIENWKIVSRDGMVM